MASLFATFVKCDPKGVTVYNDSNDSTKILVGTLSYHVALLQISAPSKHFVVWNPRLTPRRAGAPACPDPRPVSAKCGSSAPAGPASTPESAPCRAAPACPDPRLVSASFGQVWDPPAVPASTPESAPRLRV